jgi:hypothetical protein
LGQDPAPTKAGGGKRRLPLSLGERQEHTWAKAHNSPRGCAPGGRRPLLPGPVSSPQLLSRICRRDRLDQDRTGVAIAAANLREYDRLVEPRACRGRGQSGRDRPAKGRISRSSFPPIRTDGPTTSRQLPRSPRYRSADPQRTS